jgi:hypothetical protein
MSARAGGPPRRTPGGADGNLAPPTSPHMSPPPPSRMRILVKLFFTVVVLLAFALFVWSSDRIGFQGERTVYTVTCADGEWRGEHCTGHLVASDRHTFRASRSRQEVLYWVYGSSRPSGKYGDCRVENRSNWTCNVTASDRRTITYEMSNDRPVHGSEGLALPFHAVPKWKWWAIRYGVATFSDAEP